jgi:hypothetical protein
MDAYSRLAAALWFLGNDYVEALADVAADLAVESTNWKIYPEAGRLTEL